LMLSVSLLLLLFVADSEVNPTAQPSEPPTQDWLLYALAIGAVAAGVHFFRTFSFQPNAKPQPTAVKSTSSSHTSSSLPPSAMAADPNKAWTLAELSQYNGSDTSKPLLLGCGGKVFDVSSARGFYGPGAAYGVFAGKDASRGLARMEIEYKGADISDLSGSQQVTLQEVTATPTQRTPASAFLSPSVV
jgi:predicted heme/steroid binding protein